MSEHVILVAFQVTAETREEAENRLLMVLPRPAGLPRGSMPANDFLECWWVAEDDRRDGSDNDSAIFVPPGYQQPFARAVAAITGTWHNVPDYPSDFHRSDGLLEIGGGS